jgi:hypothetical protein
MRYRVGQTIHIVYMERDEILIGNPEGKRPLGRPRH